MFEAFYGLERTPLQPRYGHGPRVPDPQDRRDTGTAPSCASRQWFALLTGDCGTGKPILIRKLSALLAEKNNYRVLYPADSKLTKHFYNGLLEQMRPGTPLSL